MARVRQGAVLVSRANFGEFFPAWLRRRRPYVTAGTWADYESTGASAFCPTLPKPGLTAITTFDVATASACWWQH